MESEKAVGSPQSAIFAYGPRPSEQFQKKQPGTSIMREQQLLSLSSPAAFTRYGLALLVVVFISFLFPKQAPFPYTFTLGEPWNYEDLLAERDFDFQLAPVAAREEPKAADALATYVRDAAIVEQKKAAYEQAFAQELQDIGMLAAYPDVSRRRASYLAFGRGFIERVYAKGIIGVKESSAATEVRLLSDDGEEVVRLSDFYSPSEIALVVGDSLFNSGLQEAEFLIPLLDGLFSPNIFYQEVATPDSSAMPNFAPAVIPIYAGEKIIGRGEVVDEKRFQKLSTYKRFFGKSSPGIFFGYFLLTSILIGILLFYLFFNFKQVFQSIRQLIFMFFWLVVYSYLVYLLEATPSLSVYLIPFCIVPIVVKVFFNDQLALFVHIVVVLIASMLCSEGYEFTFLQIMAGIVVLLSNIEVRNWSRFFLSIFAILLAYGLGHLGLQLIQQGTLGGMDFSRLNLIALSVFLTMLAYPMIPLLERIFGFTSAITLVELSDMNRPLLKELSIKAPGTLQHSLQVGNLAEAAAGAIGADPLLVKVAALYHDIGKMKNPTFFIENQSSINPHDSKGDLESAQIIIDHVKEGEAMAQKAGLPQILIDFIKSHHGTTRTEYFYRNYRKKYPNQVLEEGSFRYPGPRPVSKEETILMLADSLEAACKSLQNPTGKSLNDRVESVVAGKIADGQLVNSALSFQELETCVREFKMLLRSIHHVRIEYPK